MSPKITYLPGAIVGTEFFRIELAMLCVTVHDFTFHDFTFKERKGSVISANNALIIFSIEYSYMILVSVSRIQCSTS